jgi:hypothetical protein
MKTSERICLIATVRSTVAETLCFVNYHLNIGIDEMIIFFDDPNDAAAARLSDYAAVRSIRCDAAYWQERGSNAPIATVGRQEINVNYGLKLAAQTGCDWIIHMDGDELLLPNGDIKTALLGQPSDVVRFAMKEAVSERDRYDCIFEATLFKEPVTQEKDAEAAMARSLSVFFDGEYFRGHSASKTAVRTASKIEWMGIHGPERPEMAEIVTDQLVLLHYDCVGIENWKNKWVKRIHDPKINPRLRPNRVKQRELFIEAYGNASAELELYSRLHKISERDKRILMQRGLLRVITLPHELFMRPQARPIASSR